MSKEKTFVINPLLNWFKKQKAAWKLYTPKYATAATGWDLEARRKNQDLLIEAKYIDGPFLSSFTGLVTAPLANRRQHFMRTKYRSWSYGICWAIGSAYETRNIYQILFDYFVRNPKFWKHYMRDLRLKYIFFVREEKVAKIPFSGFLELATRYGKVTEGKRLKEKRSTANSLMEEYRYS